MKKDLSSGIWDDIDFSSNGGVSIKVILSSYIKDLIKSNTLNYNDKLQSQRQLANYIGVSLQTITRVINELVDEGFLYTIPRKGVYVSNQYTAKNVHHPLENEEKIVNLSTNSPAIFNDLIIDNIKLHSDKLANETISNKDIKALNKFIEKKEGRDYNVQNLFITYGCYQAIFIALLFLKLRYKKLIILLEKISFSPILQICISLNIRVEYIDIFKNKNCKNLEIIDQISRREKSYKCVLYVVNPLHNPMLYTFHQSYVENLSESAKKNDIYIIEDSSYFFSKIYTSFYELAPEKTFKIFTTSKFLPSMLRLGFMYIPDMVDRELVSKLYGSASWSPPLIEANIFASLIYSGFIKNYLYDYMNEILERNLEARDILGKHIYKRDDCGCHILVKNKNINLLSLAKEKIILSDGGGFIIGEVSKIKFHRLSLISVKKEFITECDFQIKKVYRVI